MNALVTGASGFVGNYLARFLLQQGHAVHLILRRGHSEWRLKDIAGDVEIHIADLLDAAAVRREVECIRPDWIFHLAARGAYSLQTDVTEILQTNIMGTVNLVQACLSTGFEAFVNTGSSSEYGFKDHSPSERELPEPNSHYAVAKASATMFCSYTARSTGLRISTLRLYSVFGPYEEPTRFIPTLILTGFRNEFPPLVNPRVARDFVYADDVVRAYHLAATVPTQEPGAVYNVGTGVQTTIGQAVEVARRLLNISPEPQWSTMPDRIWDTDTWCSDSGLIREKLGWTPQFSFEEGFTRMVDWFRSEPSVMQIYNVYRK